MSILFTPLILFGANGKQERLEQAIKDVVLSYNNKNDTLLNTYIDPENGVYFILKSNNESSWMHRNQICLTKECINKLNLPNPYGQILLEQRLDTLFYNPNSTKNADNSITLDEKEKHILTNTIRQTKQEHYSYINNDELRKIWKIESNSKRITVSALDETFGGRKFTFYLSYLNNNWYLSIIVITTKLT